MAHFSENLRRIMARFNLTIDQIVENTGLDTRTIKGILNGSNRPHARTLHRLANGLGVSTDEFFQTPSLLAHQMFDRESNPVVNQALAEHCELFEGWAESDFDELYSRFGTGGALTLEGTLQTAQKMNAHREVHRKVAVLLESGEADLLTSFLEILYQRVLIPPTISPDNESDPNRVALLSLEDRSHEAP